MSVIYALVGYDKRTERMGFRHLIQASDTAGIKRIAGVTVDDDRQAGDLELGSSQIRDVAEMMKSTSLPANMTFS
jgi:hypothetical protein